MCDCERQAGDREEGNSEVEESGRTEEGPDGRGGETQEHQVLR